MTEACPFGLKVIEGQDRTSPDPVAVVKVVGEVDMATAPEMERVLLDVVEQGPADVVVDMAEVGFIDVIGIGILANAAQEARASGGSVTLRDPGRQVRRVCDLVGLNGALPIEDCDGGEVLCQGQVGRSTGTELVDGLGVTTEKLGEGDGI
jgi:anti-anti-sigma factor